MTDTPIIHPFPRSPVQVRAVVSEATKIGMAKLPSPDPALKALIRLVKGDYNKFLAEQFKKVKRCTIGTSFPLDDTCTCIY